MSFDKSSDTIYLSLSCKNLILFSSGFGINTFVIPEALISMSSSTHHLSEVRLAARSGQKVELVANALKAIPGTFVTPSSLLGTYH